MSSGTQQQFTPEMMQMFMQMMGGGGAGGAASALGGLAAGGLGAASALNPITAGIAAVPEIFKLVTGIKQAIDAKKLEKANPWVDYKIPNAQTAALNIAQNQAMNQQVPGQALIENRMGANAATGARNIQEMGGSSAERLASMASLFNNNAQGIKDLGIDAANFNMQNQRNLQNELHTQAGFQDKAWDINHYQRYQQAAQKAAALREAFSQNTMSALKGLGGAAASTINSGSGQNPAGGYMGSNSAQSSVTTSIPTQPMDNTPIQSAQTLNTPINSGVWGNSPLSGQPNNTNPMPQPTQGAYASLMGGGAGNIMNPQLNKMLQEAILKRQLQSQMVR